jgi:uncharacterized membrane protein
MKPRLLFIDVTRTLAIFLMVIFHFTWDLKALGFITTDLNRNLFWWTLPRIIVFLFLLSMGMSLRLNYQIGIDRKRFLIRLAKIASAAALISVVTYFAFPSTWIYFGTLHCIALTSIMALPFLRYPKISGLLGVIIIFPSLFFNYDYPWFSLGHASMDYIPPLPWFGAVLIGIYLTAMKVPEKMGEMRIARPLQKLITFPSTHSLKIYLLHQPVLYGLLFVLKSLL